MNLDFSTDTVLYDVTDGIAVITLNRPTEGNAITREMTRGMQSAWAAVECDPAVRVAIVTGSGERHFCTGASVSDLSQDSGLLRRGLLAEEVRISSHQCGVGKPVICLVNGLVASGGLHFVVDADIVVAAATAHFMDTHTSVGQVGAIENIGLARRAGLGAAMLLTLAGRHYRMPAQRAYELGMVDLIEPDPGAARDRALSLAQAIARNAPSALRRSKEAIWASMETGYQAAMERGWTSVMDQWSHADFVEGPAAFAERREPRWSRD